MPERVAAPRRAKVIVRENAFPPAGMVERTHRVRVGVWGRDALNDRAGERGALRVRCRAPARERTGGARERRDSGPASAADQLSERPRSLGRV